MNESKEDKIQIENKYLEYFKEIFDLIEKQKVKEAILRIKKQYPNKVLELLLKELGLE